jgi:hypothetical protein
LPLYASFQERDVVMILMADMDATSYSLIENIGGTDFENAQLTPTPLLVEFSPLTKLPRNRSKEETSQIFEEDGNSTGAAITITTSVRSVKMQ